MVTWDYQEKSGTNSPGGWHYNEVDLTYNQANDPESGNIVYYNGSGLSSSWTYLTKTVAIMMLMMNII